MKKAFRLRQLGDQVGMYTNNMGPIVDTSVMDKAGEVFPVLGEIIYHVGNRILFGFNRKSLPEKIRDKYSPYNHISVKDAVALISGAQVWDNKPSHPSKFDFIVSIGDHCQSLDPEDFLPTEVNSQPVTQPNQTNTKVSETQKMEKNSLLDMMKKDSVTAAYRVAASQMTKGTKAAILGMMAKNGSDGSKLKAIEDLLDTDFGESAISVLLGLALGYIPNISEDPRAKRLAEEFRVNGMATAGNAVFDIVLKDLAPILSGALSNLPALPEETATASSASTKARIAAPEAVPAPEKEEVVSLPAKASAAA